MKRKPINRKEPLLDRKAKALSFTYGIIADIVVLTIFYLLDNYTHLPLNYLRTFMFVAIGSDALIYVFSLKSLNKSLLKTDFFDNLYLLAAVGLGFVMIIAAVYSPALNFVLKTTPLHLPMLAFILALGIFKLFLMEVIKWFYNREA